jgi:hypothetical protein
MVLVASDGAERLVSVPPVAVRFLERYTVAAGRLATVVRDAEGVEAELVGHLIRLGLVRPLEPRVHPAIRSRPNTREICGIITADRPHVLARCLRSAMVHCGEGEDARFLVIDGSLSDAHAHATQHAVHDIGRTLGKQAVYVGPHERSSIIRALETSGVSGDVLTAALVGGTGASRNLLVLLTQDARVVMIDDDIVCTPWTLPRCSDELSVAGHGDCMVTSFHPSRPSALAGTVDSDVDLLAQHGRVLGMELAVLMEVFAGRVTFHNTCSHLAQMLANEQPATVRVSFAGVVGDSGASCPYRMLFGDSALLSELFSEEASFETALSSREVRRIAPSVSIAHGQWCMSYCMGLANTQPTPPFMPTGRNQDGVFGAMLRAVDSDALCAYLPYGVVHDSSRPSAYSDDIPSASAERLADVCLATVEAATRGVVSHSPMTRMRRIARAFEEVGDCRPRDFKSFLVRSACEFRNAQMVRARAIAAAGAPPVWHEAFARYSQVLARHMTTSRFGVPTEFGDQSERQAIDSTQRFMRDFGALISAWPDICTRASELKHRWLPESLV